MTFKTLFNVVSISISRILWQFCEPKSEEEKEEEECKAVSKEHEIEIFQEAIILLQNRLDWKVPAVKQSKIGVSVRRSSVQLRKYARRLPLWITLDALGGNLGPFLGGLVK